MGGHAGFYERAYISCIHLWSLKLACSKEFPALATFDAAQKQDGQR